jgi:cysteinyl-tRNA synthetase
MTTIRLRNTLTRKVEEFVPLDPSNVRMYVCGPTVYDRAHLGNARPVVVFDVLYRLLRHVYGKDHVTYVRNFTDVDDRINETALPPHGRCARHARGSDPPADRETIAWYHADMDALGALRPDHEPRATEYIPEMIAMIEGLIARGHAYAAEGHVLFRVRSYGAYGALSGRSVDDMIAGARVEVAPFKEDPMDFVLWKPSDSNLPGWDSPWGRGRPGWHIECSAMAQELLGARFDIHGGGIDLQFPHHENEIAQSCCAHGAADSLAGFAQVWMHNEMLLVEGRKMSKSLGNFFTVRDLLDQGIPGEVIRYVFLMTHYSKPMDWTQRKAVEAELALAGMARLLGRRGQQGLLALTPTEPFPEVVDALSDDLNTHLALSLLHPKRIIERLGAGSIGEQLGRIYASQLLLGFDLKASNNALDAAKLHDTHIGIIKAVSTTPPELLRFAGQLSSLRETALTTKDFAPVDALKTALVAAGVEVRMSNAGVELLPGPGFDPAKLEGLE